MLRFLAAGHSCLDFVHEVKCLPGPGQKVQSLRYRTQVGGNAANAAVALTRLGAAADLCSVLGNRMDDLTQQLVHRLVVHGVGVECAFLESQQCAISKVLLTPDGERSIVSFQPAGLMYTYHCPEDLSAYEMVMGDTNRLMQVRQVFSRARAAGIKTMLDVDKPVADLKELPQADFVFFSHDSWAVFSKNGMELSDAYDELGCVVGVTDSHKPIWYTDQQGRLHRHDPLEVTAIDSLGAGDAWRAGLAMGLSLGLGLHDAIARACMTAAEHIQRLPYTKIIGG